MRMGEGPLFGNDFRTSNARSWPVFEGEAIPAASSNAPGLFSTDLYRISTADNPRDANRLFSLCSSACPRIIPTSIGAKIGGEQGEFIAGAISPQPVSVSESTHCWVSR